MKGIPMQNETVIEEKVEVVSQETIAAPVQASAPAPVSEALNDAPFDPRTGLVPRTFGQLMKLADIFSRSRLVPAHFQGKPDDCFVALQMAYRMELDPMTALQNIYIVSGKPGLSGQLVISLINRSGKLKGPVKFRVQGKGDELSVTAYGELREGDTVEFTVPWSMVKAENWDKNAKYRSMPEVMMRYRAATFLARFNFPEVIIGMHTADEWEDVDAASGTQSPAMDTAAKMRAQVEARKAAPAKEGEVK
jgi:hypothetical protein